jgi:hypothetical protein
MRVSAASSARRRRRGRGGARARRQRARRPKILEVRAIFTTREFFGCGRSASAAPPRGLYLLVRGAPAPTIGSRNRDGKGTLLPSPPANLLDAADLLLGAPSLRLAAARARLASAPLTDLQSALTAAAPAQASRARGRAGHRQRRTVAFTATAALLRGRQRRRRRRRGRSQGHLRHCCCRSRHSPSTFSTLTSASSRSRRWFARRACRTGAPQRVRACAPARRRCCPPSTGTAGRRRRDSRRARAHRWRCMRCLFSGSACRAWPLPRLLAEFSVGATWKRQRKTRWLCFNSFAQPAAPVPFR